MFITHKKGLVLDGNNPLLLFGYGGFNVNRTPEFKIERLVFLENGGVFAAPCLRGGGECAGGNLPAWPRVCAQAMP